MTALQIFAVDGIGEIVPGDDIAAIITHQGGSLLEGDIVVVTSKIVSKAAGLATTGDREALLAAETDRVVAQRGTTRIVRTHHGLTLAAAGIDASNIKLGQIIPLPRDPDHDAGAIRERLHELTGLNVAVIITDTAGRAWRIGQTDIAIGAAGITTHLDFAGVDDAYGNTLAVTSPAIADEIAGAADLVAEKLGGNPVVIIRGLPRAWLTAENGPGATTLIRDEAGDLFGLGAYDAVIAALSTGDARGFPTLPDNTVDDLLTIARDRIDLANARILADGLVEVYATSPHLGPAEWSAIGALSERIRILAKTAHLDLEISVEMPPDA